MKRMRRMHDTHLRNLVTRFSLHKLALRYRKILIHIDLLQKSKADKNITKTHKQEI